MPSLNENFLKLEKNYLFINIAKKVNAFLAENPDAPLIRMGIGDVTLPIAPVAVEAMKKGAEEMGVKETFKGYEDSGAGYDFLKNAVSGYYKSFGVDILPEEIRINDGAKSDCGNIVDIFSQDNVIAVTDPVYPVYVDSNAMSGKTGEYLKDKECWSNVIYMPCTAENNFVPELPEKTPDIIYICCPNNPTGTTLTKEQLQKWVDYANEKKAVIIYDAAYEAYISETDVPHSIYECDGAKTCAIEMRSFSKNAGFTGTRLGFTIVPKQLVDSNGTMLNSLWARRHGTKFNGAPYIIQRAGEAVYSEAGKAQTKEQIAYYMNNAKEIRNALSGMGYTVFGGVNAPYIWLQTPDGMKSWDFFDKLLNEVAVVGTPGVGF